MERGGGTPWDDSGLLRRTIDGLPAGVLTLDRDDVIVQANGSALAKAPTLRPGMALRPALESMTHVEMVDRLMIWREVSTFRAVPGGPEYHWMIWGQRNELGEIVLTFWDTDWNEVMNERRAAFTMAASHELRGPLTTLRGFAEILNMDPSNLGPEQLEAAAIIERTSALLAVLVDDVFDLSRSSFGELRLNLGETALDQVIADVASSLEPRIRERGQSLVCEVGDLPPIEADVARATQMISNLVSNASVHNGPGTTIRITAARNGGEIGITVADDGQGLPFDPPGAAFRTFQRGDHATEGDRTGSGIGLPITKLLVQLHRGWITAESPPDGGAVFTIRLPVDRGRPVLPPETGQVFD